MSFDRDHVLRAAADLLTRKATATTEEVARAAGISRATLNRHFPGRDALVRALEDFGLAECEAALDAAHLEEDAADQAVRRLVRAMEPCAGLVSFLYSENQLFEGEEQNAGWARIDERLTALFRRGQESGAFRIDLSAVWLTEAFYGLLTAGSWAVTEGRVARNDFTHMIVELLLGGATRRNTT
ncbi:TetR/AcrR family transcriptional regulator [Streptomyces sp. WAC00288]|uniref:TetR/AcrR family transcriptional regulator n=1 Tax=unclassified Streptomyces TaxID=2593676 RepID=UPI000786A5F8|nr:MULTISPECIES: TetR/AcrR family transcriptional regulator [unclassified Streptomyces]AVH94303.1 TetR/AcrR family transcriptional regulator [Streptomyces sp. WAC00288]KYG51273.1 TetR family transcriptional regulator [Streptomyces sp. WAC04657]